MLIRGRDIFILSFLTFVTVIAWVAFDIYHTATMSTIKPPIQKLLSPLPPSIDTQLIEELKEKAK